MGQQYRFRVPGTLGAVYQVLIAPTLLLLTLQEIAVSAVSERWLDRPDMFSFCTRELLDYHRQSCPPRCLGLFGTILADMFDIVRVHRVKGCSNELSLINRTDGTNEKVAPKWFQHEIHTNIAAHVTLDRRNDLP